MKILQTPPRFYPYTGGVENYVLGLSKELAKLGHDVTVICANEPPTESGKVDGVDVKRLGYVGKIANTNITPTLLLKLLSEDFDVVHTHLPTPWSADWSALVSRIKNRPLVLTYNNDITGRGFPGLLARFYNRTMLKFVLKSADRIIVHHENYIEFSPFLQKHRKKITAIPSGVDSQKFSPKKVKKNKNTIFFLSVLDRFHGYKGLDVLLEALVEIKRKIPDARLIIGGKGELLEYYRKKTAQLGIGESVNFVGFIPDSEMADYYNRCNVFVLPTISSVQEGFGIVLLEAMACETPVVSTELVGVADNINKAKSGIIIKPGDKKALAEAIVRILQDDLLANEMGRNGRKLVGEEYNWTVLAKRVGEIYESLLKK